MTLKTSSKNYGLQDLPRASRNLQSLTGEPPVREACAEIMETLLECVADSAHPDSALHNFARFVDAASDPLQLYQILRDAPFLISILAKSFGSSTYFSDILIRNPEYINGFVANSIIAPPKPREIMDGELCQSLRSVDSVEQKLERAPSLQTQGEFADWRPRSHRCRRFGNNYLRVIQSGGSCAAEVL